MSAIDWLPAGVQTAGVERALRLVLVTPELHQIHHSLEEHEQQRNLGAVFSLWDRAFGTFQAEPVRGFEAMEFGVDEVAPEECVQPLHMLTAPFRRARQVQQMPFDLTRQARFAEPDPNAFIAGDRPGVGPGTN